MHYFMGQDACEFCRIQSLDKCRVLEQGEAYRGHGLNGAEARPPQPEEE